VEPPTTPDPSTVFDICADSSVTQISSESGVIREGGALYGNNHDCQAVIRAPEGMAVQLSFSAFSTESNWDFLLLYSGDSPQGLPLAALHGSELPDPIISYGSTMFLQFVTDASIFDDGFTASWSFVDVPQMPSVTDTVVDMCAYSEMVVLTSAVGTIHEGDGDYDDNHNCGALIRASPGESVRLEFSEFNTEAGWDYLYVYSWDGNVARLMGRFHGASVPPPVVSSSNEMVLLFVTDGSVTSGGFTASWSFVEPPTTPDPSTVFDICADSSVMELTGETGTIHESPGTYGNENMCQALIRAPEGQNVRLEFVSFATELNFDFLRVYSGESADGTLLASLHGTGLPDPITSVGTTLFLQFTSDGSVVWDGFVARWTFVDSGVSPTSRICEAGTFVADDGGCELCADGTFSTTTNAVVCQPWSECPAGMYVDNAIPPSRRSDRVCNACSLGTFTAAANQYSCSPWQTCWTIEEELAEPSTTSDRICNCLCRNGGTCVSRDNRHVCACARGWINGPQGLCEVRDDSVTGTTEPPLVCQPGAFVSNTGGCELCPDGTFSVSTNAVECQPWTVCPAGTYVDNTISPSRGSDRVCNACASGTFSTSQNQYACTPWRTCWPFVESELTAPTDTSDRVCTCLCRNEGTCVWRNNRDVCACADGWMNGDLNVCEVRVESTTNAPENTNAPASSAASTGGSSSSSGTTTAVVIVVVMVILALGFMYTRNKRANNHAFASPHVQYNGSTDEMHFAFANPTYCSNTDFAMDHSMEFVGEDNFQESPYAEIPAEHYLDVDGDL